MLPSHTLKGMFKNDNYKIDTMSWTIVYNGKEAWWKQKISIVSVGLKLWGWLLQLWDIASIFNSGS
jgi:hypothetical protein